MCLHSSISKTLFTVRPKVQYTVQFTYLGDVKICLYHTLSIRLEMEFTSNIFFKTSVCTDYSQNMNNNKKNIFFFKQIIQKFLLEDILKFGGL